MNTIKDNHNTRQQTQQDKQNTQHTSKRTNTNQYNTQHNKLYKHIIDTYNHIQTQSHINT